MIVPLRARGRTVGLLTLFYAEGHAPTDEDVAVLAYTAAQSVFGAEDSSEDAMAVSAMAGRVTKAGTPFCQSGPGCDAQYLFAEDVLGCTRGHKPRHAKTYRDFAATLAAASV